MQFCQIIYWDFFLNYLFCYLCIHIPKSVIVQLDFLGNKHMLLQYCLNFYSVYDFEENGLTMNNQISSILFEETSKF